MITDDKDAAAAARSKDAAAAKWRVLAESHALLVDQIAEILVAQREAGQQRQQVNQRVAAMEQSLAHNTDMTSELLGVVVAVKGGLKVLAWLGMAAKWCSYIAAGAVAVYTLAQIAMHGAPPPK